MADGSGKRTYIRDASGATFAVLDQNDNVLFYNLGAYGKYDVAQNKKFYYLKDHLGNIRATMDAAGSIVSSDDYYPFGKNMNGRSTNNGNPENKYKYSGKELDEEKGLDCCYFGARSYDPEIGRMLSLDRFKEKYPGLNPYQYTANNPILFVDVNGDSIRITANQDHLGELIKAIEKATGTSLNYKTKTTKDGLITVSIQGLEVKDDKFSEQQGYLDELITHSSFTDIKVAYDFHTMQAGDGVFNGQEQTVYISGQLLDRGGNTYKSDEPLDDWLVGGIFGVTKSVQFEVYDTMAHELLGHAYFWMFDPKKNKTHGPSIKRANDVRRLHGKPLRLYYTI